MLKMVMVVGVACVFVLSWYVNDVRRLTRDYACTTPFGGAFVEASVRFALAEYQAYCVIGANSEGLYLGPSIARLNRERWWRRGNHVIRTPLVIPWTALQYHGLDTPFGAYVRFDVPSLRVGLSPVCFFISRDTAEPLLAGVGRHVSPG